MQKILLLLLTKQFLDKPVQIGCKISPVYIGLKYKKKNTLLVPLTLG